MISVKLGIPTRIPADAGRCPDCAGPLDLVVLTCREDGVPREVVLECPLALSPAGRADHPLAIGSERSDSVFAAIAWVVANIRIADRFEAFERVGAYRMNTSPSTVFRFDNLDAYHGRIGSPVVGLDADLIGDAAGTREPCRHDEVKPDPTRATGLVCCDCRERVTIRDLPPIGIEEPAA